MAAPRLREGDKVVILAGDEAGGWGIVRGANGDHWDVAVYGGEIRVYGRAELRKPRKQEG